MTKSTITRERLEEIRDCSWMDDLGLSMCELSELASMALAAMGDEPAAYADPRAFENFEAGSAKREWMWKNPGADLVPLYRHAQPEPVEVRNKLKAEALADLLKDAREYAPLTAEQWELLANNWHQTFVGLSGEGDTCRAAMLQAEPVTTANKLGNSPAIPDTWIPVSERMPENDVDVQIYCPGSKEQMVGYLERNEQEGYFRYAMWRTGDGIYCQPSHWMPLPAAPQEMKGE